MTITTDTTDTGTDACGPGGSCALVARTGARTGQPAMVVPGAMDALQALGGSIAATGIPPRTLALVNLRVSQINGCGTCLLGDLKAAREHGITDEELVTVAAWRETPFFTAAERAALALAEAVTRIADTRDPVPDEIWHDAAITYDDETLAALVLGIANINLWNRLNIATAQVAGTYEW